MTLTPVRREPAWKWSGGFQAHINRLGDSVFGCLALTAYVASGMGTVAVLVALLAR